MKKVFAITAVAGLLAVGCSSNDANTGGTYDSTGASWSSDSNTGHMSGSETRGIGTEMTPDNTSTLPQSQQQSNTEQDATPSGTVESGQSSYSPTNNSSALPNSSGSAPTPGGSDTGADSSSGNLDTNSNTNNVDGSLNQGSQARPL